MKNKRLLLILPLLILVIIYMVNKEFAISFNQVSEMLKSGNSNSLQMFYYDGGYFGWLVSMLITIYGIIAPIFSKATLFTANTSYFGIVFGGILVIISTFLALAYIFAIGRWIGTLIKSNMEKLKWIAVILALLSSILVTLVPIAIFGLLISGILNRNSRLGILAISIGTILAGLIQIII